MVSLRSSARLGRCLAVLCLLLLGSSALGARAWQAGAQGAQAPQASPVVVITLDDTVNTVSAEYVTRGLKFAAARHARAAVLVLNTPGGLDSAMRSIIEGIFASPVPVVGYVSPSGARAASAGFYILLSCNVAAMAPGTNSGAAHPVLLGGASPDKIEAAKMESDASAFIRSIATQRRRNLDLAEKGVLQSASFTPQEALSGGLIDRVAPSLDALLASLPQVGGETAAAAPRLAYGMSVREHVLDMDATLAFALLIIGALLIYVEFSHPGMLVPGVVGLILVVVSLFALSLLPISWAGAGLLILAFILFVLEAKFPTHGAFAAGGVACLALGGILLIDAPVPQMRVGTTVAVGVAVGFGIIAVTLMQLVVRAQRHRVVTGAVGLIGEAGVALTALALTGTVYVHGERWTATASEPLAAGTAVRVRAVTGLRLEVESAGSSRRGGVE